MFSVERLKMSRAVKYFHSLKERTMWNSVINFINETFILVTLSSILNFYYVNQVDSETLNINYYFSLAFLTLVVFGYPILILHLFLKKEKFFKSEWT